MSAPTLRPYQVASLDAICDARESGTNRVLIKKPTGTGKTVTFAEMLKWPRLAAWLATFPRHGARMLVIAHREELLDQAAAKIQAANPGILVSIEKGDRYSNRHSDVVIASIQTLAARKCHRLIRMLHHHDFRLVVVDEAHHSAAPSYRTVLAHLQFLPMGVSAEGDAEAATYDDVAHMKESLEGWDRKAPKDRLLVGVTATPNRTDAIGLGCVFQTIAYSYALKAAIADQWLVPIVPWTVETVENLDNVRTTAGEFNQRDLAAAVNVERRNLQAFAAWEEKASDRSTLAFTVDVAHAHAVAALWQAHGYQAVALSGETPKETRRAMLADFLSGRLQFIANCIVLTEGTDLPITSCILHLKPTKSPTLYEQMTGRGLRLFPGKSECLVIDVVDIARRHSLQAAPVLYGLPPGLTSKGEPLQQTEEALEALALKYAGFDIEAALAGGRLSLAQLQSQATTFDVWAVPALGAFGAGRAMNWIKAGEDVYRLQYPWGDGYEVLSVDRDLLGHFTLSLTLKPAGGGLARQRTLALDVESAVRAAEIAERFILDERRSVMRLKSTDAQWRSGPASEKQLAVLRRWRIPFNPKTITKGQASDLLDLAAARRA